MVIESSLLETVVEQVGQILPVVSLDQPQVLRLLEGVLDQLDLCLADSVPYFDRKLNDLYELRV